jgi:hypothetical protein
MMSASHLQDSTGTVVANATISFTPVTNAGLPISYKVNGLGQAVDRVVTTLVTSGGFSIQLADVSLTQPSNVCYATTVRDNVTGKQLLGPGYNCVQPSGSGAAITGLYTWCTAATLTVGGSCNFDLWSPVIAANIVMNPAGPAGPTGATGPAGSGLSGLTGDVNAGPGGGSQIATLPNVNSTPGACGDVSDICAITTNAKGLVTNEAAHPLNVGSALAYQPTPPIPGQFIVLYPTSVANTVGGMGSYCGGTLPTGSIASSVSSAFITVNGCGNPFNSNYWGAAWSGFVLPPSISSVSVTAVYAFGLTSYWPYWPGSVGRTVQCLSDHDTGENIIPGGGLSTWSLRQTTALLNSTVAGDIGSITCSALMGYSNSPPDTVNLDIASVGIIVYYTGTALPSPTAVSVLPPLSYNPALNQLSLDPQGYSLPPMTYALLQATYACENGSLEGWRGAVTDSTVATWGSPISGGGANHVPAYCNGGSWIVD